MPDLTRSIDVLVPDAYVARLTAWVTAASALMEDSGEVDANGDPIMVPVVETLTVKFDRIAGEILRHELRSRVRTFEQRALQNSITDIDVQ